MLEISGTPTQTVAGASLALTITLRDSVGDIATEYTGTMALASSDPQAILPTTYTFSVENGGQHLFSGVMLRTVGAQIITATDINSPALRSTVIVNVVPGKVSASLSQLRVTSPHRADGSAAATIILTATDAYSNPASAQTVWLVASGISNTLTEASGTTNAAGVFSTTLTSMQAQAKEIRALVGSDQSYTWVAPGALIEFTRSSITGTVFSDANRDNMPQANEPGLGAVQITLYAASGTTPLKTTVTNGAGQYQFTGLEPGTYRVIQTPLDQFAFSASGILTVTLGDFTTLANQSFGNYAVALIEGKVWSDGNQDGSQQVFEPPIPGVTINAYDGNALLAASVTTDLSGTYRLDLAAPLPAAPDNFIFNSGGLAIQEPAAALIANSDFSRGLTPLSSATYPVNYDFETGDLSGWTASNTNTVQVMSDVNNLDGYYLRLNGTDVSGYTDPFLVPADAQSLRFWYWTSTYRGSTLARPLYVYVLNGSGYTVTTLIGTVSGSQNEGWQLAVLDLQAFQGQTIQLRFRSDYESYYNSVTRLDTLSLNREVPDWTPSTVANGATQVVSDVNNLVGSYLRLSGTDVSGYTTPFLVPADTQSLRFHYWTSTYRGSTLTRPLYVYVLNGPEYAVTTLIGTVSGAQNDGWKTAVLDLQAFQGQIIQLRFRTDTEDYYNSVTRLDNLSLNIETPGWTLSNASLGGITDAAPPADPGTSAPVNTDFSLGLTALAPSTYPLNFDFARGLTPLSPATYPVNYDFETGDLSGWTASNTNTVQVMSDVNNLDGYYLRLNGTDVSGYTDPFLVPADAQSLRFWYWTSTYRGSTLARPLYVYVLNGSGYTVTTLIGTVSGSQNEGWQLAVLDLQAFQGQTIQLRFRSDYESYYNSVTRLDTLSLNREVPDWTPSTVANGATQVVSDVNNLVGSYLRLSGTDVSGYTTPFLVPADTQSLRFHYWTSTYRGSTLTRPLYVYVLNGPEYAVTTLIGTVSGAQNDGWKTAVLDLQAFQGQIIQLRFRTDTEDYYNSVTRLDNLSLNIETPGWTLSNASLGGIQATDGVSGSYLFLGQYNVSAYSIPFLVPINTDRLRFDYFISTYRDPATTRPLNVYAYSGDNFGVATLLGTLTGSQNEGWKQATLNMTTLRGRVVKLRFATDAEDYWNSIAKIDNVELLYDASGAPAGNYPNPDGAYLWLNRYETSAYSAPFLVLSTTNSVRFDYQNWTYRDGNTSRPLYVYALSGPNFEVSTSLGTAQGSATEGWKQAEFNLSQQLRGQVIKLRFRSDYEDYWNSQSKIDNVTLINGSNGSAGGNPINPGGTYLSLNRYEVSAYSNPLLVPTGTQSLRFDYLNSTYRSGTTSRPLYVYALLGPGFTNTVSLGTLWGSALDGWKPATLDISAYQGQTVKLRFRTDTEDYWSTVSKIDNVYLLPMSTTPYTITEINLPNYTPTTSDTIPINAFGGAHFTLDFGDSGVDSYNSMVKVAPLTPVADGVSAAIVTVTVRSSSNVPMAGQWVEVQAPGAAITITQPLNPTDAQGQAVAETHSTRAQNVLVSARTISDNVTLAQVVPITFTAGTASAARSAFAIQPSMVAANGLKTALITVTLRDAFDNLASGRVVTVTHDGTAAFVDLKGATTNAQGVITGTLRSTQAQTVTLHAIDLTDNITVSQSAAVRFTGVDPQQSSILVTPSSIVANGVSRSTLTVTLINNAEPATLEAVKLILVAGPPIYLNGERRTIGDMVDIGETDANGCTNACCAGWSSDIDSLCEH